MPTPWKKQQTELAKSLVAAGVSMMIDSDSSDEEHAPKPSGVPLFRIANLNDIVLEDSDASFEEFKSFDEADDMDFDEFPTFDSLDDDLEPFDDIDDTFPLFDDEESIAGVPLIHNDRLYEGSVDEDTYKESNKAVDELMGFLLIALAEEIEGKRGPYGQFLKSKDWFETSMSWPPTWFENTYRMSLRTFWRIAILLEENPIFKSKGNRPQRPVPVQLACFLYRYGRYGSTAFDAAATLSLGVGTVFLYCKRVVRALREVALDCVAWLNEERKEEIKLALEELSGIPGAIGAGDGSLLGLKSKPHVEGNSFVTYKGFLGVNIFCVVDHEKRFIVYEGGWPGCKSDKVTFRDSKVWQCHGDMIQPGEVLLVDKGFFSSPYTCRPYDKNDINRGTRDEKRRKRQFNSRFSKARVIVEHAFGMLKMRFPAASCMGTSINIQTNHKAVEALVVLHNLCIDYDDAGAPEEYSVEDDEDLPAILHDFPGHVDHRQHQQT